MVSRLARRITCTNKQPGKWRIEGADHFPQYLANIPSKQAVTTVAIESLGQGNSYLDGAFDTGRCRLKHAGGQKKGRGRRTRKIRELAGATKVLLFSQRGCPDKRLRLLLHPARPSTPFYVGGIVGDAIEGREAIDHFHWEQG